MHFGPKHVENYKLVDVTIDIVYFVYYKYVICMMSVVSAANRRDAWHGAC